MDSIRIRVLRQAQTYSVVYKQGEVLHAKLRPDGRAVLLTGKYVFNPDEFEIVIEDEVFDKLLAG